MPGEYHLIVDGEHVHLQGIKQFLVKSRSQSGDHTVEWDDTEGWRCSCVGFQVRKKCRHQAAIERWSRDEAEVRLGAAEGQSATPA